MSGGVVHIVGAGLAGLSAAVALAGAGRGVVLYEAGPAAGGRCRSYFDRELGCRIDNGNHLLLSGNHATMTYLETIGARNTLAGPGGAIFPFMDLSTGERWTVAPNQGRIPWWVLVASRGVKGARLADFLALPRLLRVRGDEDVASVLGGAGVLYRRLLEPLAVAALNTKPEVALARLLRAVVEETLMQGGAACQPLVPRVGLSESFVDPALAWLAARGATLHAGRRITALNLEGGAVRGLAMGGEAVAVAPGDAVVLAVPPWVAGGLLPGLAVPDRFEAIVNVHYRVAAPPGSAAIVGLVGGMAEWVFTKKGVVSITISAAGHLADMAADELARRCWVDTSRALGLCADMPPFRVVKEKRATFAATACQERRRPEIGMVRDNLVLAGDWTATGLPATIEGAIRSGRTAAGVLQQAGVLR